MTRKLTRLAILVLCLAGLGVAALLAIHGIGRARFALAAAPAINHEPVAATDQRRRERGEYLARMGDCVACHTAPAGKPFAGGLALDTGFGSVISSNITPDPKTGIGGWSLPQFRLALRHGIGKDGKYLYPAMPYNAYAKMSDSDISDLKYFLDSIDRVSQHIASNQMKFPFSIRPLMFGWNMLFLSTAPFSPDPKESEQLNRGAYIVQGPGHCAACHSPKNPLGVDKPDYFLQGAVLQNWYAPRIAGNGFGAITDWSRSDIATYLKTGANAHGIAAGPMAEAIANSTQFLSDKDLEAVATYLKSLPAGPAQTAVPVAADHPDMHLGQKLYSEVCAACHGASGKGVNTMGPALAGNAVVAEGPSNNVLRLLLHGGYSARTGTYPSGFAMPSFDWKFSDSEVAALATYVRNAWGNAGAAVPTEDVAVARRMVQE